MDPAPPPSAAAKPKRKDAAASSPPPKRRARDRGPLTRTARKSLLKEALLREDAQEAAGTPPLLLMEKDLVTARSRTGRRGAQDGVDVAPTLAAVEPKPSPSVPPQRRTPAPRRRGAAKAKRKASAAKSASTPPPKRQARDPPPPHGGPLSRAARQSLLKPAPGSARSQEAVTPTPLPAVEQEVEAVRSRGNGVHVVPTFAGWFAWNEIHPIEKQTLPSFFSGKSEKKTPELYLGIRNFIMKKFHANPRVHVESKDLCELSIGEMDARLEVLEFLSHWGLVNFHPFPPAGQERSKPVDCKSNTDAVDKTSLVDKLFQFEKVESYLVPVPNKAEVLAPRQVPSLLCEPKLADDLSTAAAAESSIEYHCNSCSVDCTQKHYHCRTQVDYDLCYECYSEGRFDVGMSEVDFILMESGEIPGSGDTSWTDEETLLLLEALEIFQDKWGDIAEIFQDKWGDIAEHVGTKSKAQCMLHFLQMPVQDLFLDGADVNGTSQETAGHIAGETGISDRTDKMEVEDKSEEMETAGEKVTNKPDAQYAETESTDNDVWGNKDTKISGDIDVDGYSSARESNKPSDSDPAKKETFADVTISGKNASDTVIDVLKSAFQAIGHISEEKDLGSFDEAGNPVMALAAFLSGLVEHDDAVASCSISLRVMTDMFPALQLATAHCFILQDPPNDLNSLPVSVSPPNGAGEQKHEDATPNPNNMYKDTKEKQENVLSVKKQNVGSISPEDDQQSNGKGQSRYSFSRRTEIQRKGTPETRFESGDKAEHQNSNKSTAASNVSLQRLQRAAATAISAAAVKAKLLAEQEEDQIRELAALVIEKQFEKIQAKMSLFTEFEDLILQARQYNEKTRRSLLTERSAIIAARMAGMPSSRRNQAGAGLAAGYGADQQLRQP